VVDASEKFLERLKTVVDPEEKRKIVGRTFVEVFEAKAHELEAKGIKFKYLGQGTIYPDRIESSQPSKTSSRIKTHHNVGALPEKMHLKVIEPLKEFYKNEVREIGKKMGIPERFVNRKPFPGPGLAVRCIGEVTKERLSVLRRADEILIQELERTIYWEGLWQAFIVLLPVRSVGVMGDERTYEETAVIRVVESVDAMTATVPELPMGLLKDVATRITSEVKGVNRVTFDLTGKPPSTIEWE
ncbi:MAG TPA: glutamine-hydrolyzing GMP synthase, partial [Candidatus Hodarchaeales archaeon]|nr:glutamine-hydrolyzing GMP synthase [Candidatus Hodarchaeales archaeon]